LDPAKALPRLPKNSDHAHSSNSSSSARRTWQHLTVWGTATLNVSDADPSAVPSALAPFAYRNISATIDPTNTLADFLEPIDKLFRESGGTLGDQAVLETKQARHAPGLLHRTMPASTR
jgi:hypothetical protein